MNNTQEEKMPHVSFKTDVLNTQELLSHKLL